LEEFAVFAERTERTNPTSSTCLMQRFHDACELRRRGHYREALEATLEAANSGVALAMCHLATAYLRGGLALYEKKDEVVPWLLKAADAGEPRALLLLKRIGVEVAVRQFDKKAARLLPSEAQIAEYTARFCSAQAEDKMARVAWLVCRNHAELAQRGPNLERYMKERVFPLIEECAAVGDPIAMTFVVASVLGSNLRCCKTTSQQFPVGRRDLRGQGTICGLAHPSIGCRLGLC
jgi:hypothetical protein